VFFDPAQAPLNHAIFGPQFTFTGELVAGEVTIDVPVTPAPSGLRREPEQIRTGRTAQPPSARDIAIGCG